MGTIMADPSKLYLQLQELHIETGKLGNNEIAAWHDSFKPTTLNFLEWFQENMSLDNCLSICETLAYNDIKQEGNFIEGEEYEKTVEDLMLTYKESNEFDADNLESDSNFYKEELVYFNKECEYLDEINIQLKQEKTKKSAEISHIDYQRDEVAKTCLQLAEILDEVNQMLGQKLQSCFNIIENSDYDLIRFLANIELQQEDFSFLNQLEVALQDISLLEERNFSTSLSSINVLNSPNASNFNQSNGGLLMPICPFGNLETSIYSDPVDDKITDEIAERLQIAFCVHNKLSAKVEVLNCKAKFLHSFKAYLKKPGYFPKSTLIGREQNEVEVNVSNYIRHLIKQPIFISRALEQDGMRQKLKSAFAFTSKLNNLLQYQQLVLQMYSCEEQLFTNLDNFVIDTKNYVTTEIQPREDRIDAMNSTIEDYNKYCSKPIEQNWHLLPIILKIIRKDPDQSIGNLLQDIKSFENNCEALGDKIFIDDIDNMAKELQEIDTKNNLLVKFLCNKATGKICIAPCDVYHALRHVVDLIDEESKFIKHYQGLPKEYNRKLETNKWLKLKRQLWMYFLQKPEKLEQIIEEIEVYLRNKRAAFLDSAESL